MPRFKPVLKSDALLPPNTSVVGAFAMATSDPLVVSDAATGVGTKIVYDFEASLAACRALNKG